MFIPFFRGFALIVSTALLAVGAGSLVDRDPEHVKPDHRAPLATAVTQEHQDYGFDANGIPLAVIAEVGEYAVKVVEAQVGEYLTAHAVLARRVTSSGARSASYNGIGLCTGFAIPDYIIQRESGGDPWAENPSGAYGCAQTLRSHYRDGGTCAGLTPESIDDQRECVRRLSNDGSNLAPWAATR